MRIRTFIGILFALIGSVLVAFFSQKNTDLLHQRFLVTETGTVPVYAVLLVVFLAGFLPVVSLLIVRTLRQDLATRRQRRFDRESRSLQVSYRRAVDFQEDGQWLRAIAEFEAVLAHQPDDFETLLRFGQALRRQGRVEEALEVHRRASILYPQSVTVLYELAEDYVAAESTEVAREILDRILRDFPGLGLRVLLSQRDAALGRQDWSAAERMQDSIEGLRKDEAGAIGGSESAVRLGLSYQRAVRLLEADEIDEAVTLFGAIVQESSGFLPARIMLGESLSLAGDPGAAVSNWLEDWRATGSLTFLQRIEDHFIEREEPLQAITTLRQVIAEAESDLLPRFFLAKLYARLEMHDEALKVVAGLLDRAHPSAVLLYLLGKLQERRGERELAGRAFRDSLEIADVTMDLYLCDGCGARFAHWRDRCNQCGTWNSIEIHIDVEPVAGEDVVIRERPVWPVYGED